MSEQSLGDTAQNNTDAGAQGSTDVGQSSNQSFLGGSTEQGNVANTANDNQTLLGGSNEAPPTNADNQEASNANNEGADKAPVGAPENYAAFNLPEGVNIPEEIAGEFLALAKEANLSQEAAQKIVDFQIKATQTAKTDMMNEFSEINKGWREESEQFLGQGIKREERLREISATNKMFGSPELSQILNDTGLGNHPLFLKLYSDIGKNFLEGKFHEGSLRSAPKSDGELFYPQMK